MVVYFQCGMQVYPKRVTFKYFGRTWSMSNLFGTQLALDITVSIKKVK